MVITTHTIETLSTVLRRRPVIWDNIHANDYDQRRLFLGPYDGRPVQLYKTLRGMLTNPNCEYEVNFVAVHTLASWLRCAREAVEIEPMVLEAETAADKPPAPPQPGAEPMEEDANETGAQESGASQTDGHEIEGDGKDGAERKLDAIPAEPSMESLSGSSLAAEPKTEPPVQGLYDPQVALRQAVAAWLKEFSKEKSAVSKWYAKSGPYAVATDSPPVQTQSFSSNALSTNTTSAGSGASPVCSPLVQTSPTRTAKENSRRQHQASAPSGKLADPRASVTGLSHYPEC